VDALGGAPGIHSARYAQVFADKNSPDDTNTQLLLKNMIGKTDRKAQFVCAVSFVSDKLSFTVRGECHGEVIDEKRGDGGFGYDPIFFVEQYQKTLSQVTEEEKNAISHRGQAIRAAAERLNELYQA
jgi:XTP/dITP diphosphohydrolase